MDFNRILSGMIRAARLDKSFYEEVEHDTSYTQDALVVVILASVAGALGGFLSALFGGSFGVAIFSFVVSAVTGVVSYYIWVYLVHLIGTKFFKGTGDRGEVARALGFAWAPRVLNILSFIPFLGGLVGFVAWIWTIATGFIATRQSLDQDNTNAALTVVVAAVVAFIISLLIGLIFGLIGAAIGMTFSNVGSALGG
ncbi:MAG: YIP1 family protein [Chloroflexi bacterium]|nr:YIP1 family protein [Chloroflexota bacterium]